MTKDIAVKITWENSQYYTWTQIKVTDKDIAVKITWDTSQYYTCSQIKVTDKRYSCGNNMRD